MSKQILSGVRVLDLTNVLSGPFATLHLALLGAEVIKIENPKDGDLARKLGVMPALNEQLMGTSFLAQNANKKSVTLNTKTPEGKEIFKKLVKTADVLVENFRPDVMGRLGLGYATLAQIKSFTRGYHPIKDNIGCPGRPPDTRRRRDRSCSDGKLSPARPG